ncbi:acyl-CoA dehydrogenase family protein [Pandoraea norimbergensis]|uniref:Dibenzothiophene monooxygenase n=1 Tax=Pandoraea norimbergensis TaxID=93219 RepID=A0ABN4JR72_9BURK|nr:acyl-CoA dehydrogenase family protein [Pandoraea norimbergensis]ALS62673.1 monooxygenase [Pandoraea norimbergensis]
MDEPFLDEWVPAHQFGEHATAVIAVANALKSSAAQRDRDGGTAWHEREVLRDSGLLALAVPRDFGGLGADWPLILRAVRRLAVEDSSLAHLFGFQHLQVASIRLFASPEQQTHYLGNTAEHRWFWGNAVNARDTRLTVTRTSTGFELNGIKSFCSGAKGSDMLNISVTLGDAPGDRLFLAIPTQRAGITVNDDWDNLGQRQTDSGTITFDHVAVSASEVLGPPGVASSPRATLRNLIGQLILTEIYLGNALGALRDAIDYVKERARPWAMAGVATASDDALLQLRTGGMWPRLKAAVLLADDALLEFERAWQTGLDLSAQARGEVALRISAARLHAGRTALDITADIFELMGASATTRRDGFDRYWRNVRVHTLHDPLDYRQKALGQWLLTGQLPDPYG